ncbi:hypothetical protein H2200_002341 [Cladophialophora chaetospira]|uniref:Uncharacterized protein n=1 Tax=Cladophialophora chaetospira TaxID=386627 RepID=A0AA38XIQ1_9EURO|nr:hypothetical protein H2200_002341 [Cladophialophora chaetospira]
MAPNRINKRPSEAIAHDDDPAQSSPRNNNGSSSFHPFTAPPPKKPRLAAPWEDQKSPQKMGCPTSKERQPVAVRSGLDVTHGDSEPRGGSAASPSSSTAPLLPNRSALLPTPEPEVAMGGCDAPPQTAQLVLSNDTGLTPPPTVSSPETSSAAKDATRANCSDTPGTPTEPAGSRFWEALHTGKNMKGRLERFFIDVFEVNPAMGGNLNNTNVVSPYYRQGMMAGYIRTGENMVVKQDNVGINIAAMQVSREFRGAGSRLIYGEPTFFFRDPVNCKWWCKHIGELNLSNVRNLAIEPIGGWPNLSGGLGEICSLDQSDEELWHSFLSWFRSRHQLKWMYVGFNLWHRARDVAPWDRDLQDELKQWRKNIRAILYEYRGLKKAEIHDPYALGLGLKGQLGNFPLMMEQSRDSVLPRKPKQKVSLAQYIAHRQQKAMNKKMQAMLKLDRQDERQGDEERDQGTELGGFGA